MMPRSLTWSGCDSPIPNQTMRSSENGTWRAGETFVLDENVACDVSDGGRTCAST